LLCALLPFFFFQILQIISYKPKTARKQTVVSHGKAESRYRVLFLHASINTPKHTQARSPKGYTARALWKSGKRLQKNTEKQPCIRKQLPDAAERRRFQPYKDILHAGFCSVKGFATI